MTLNLLYTATFSGIHLFHGSGATRRQAGSALYQMLAVSLSHFCLKHLHLAIHDNQIERHIHLPGVVS